MIRAGILIGGHSRRMGRPKALIVHENQLLIERTVAIVRQHVDETFLLGEPPNFVLPQSLNGLTRIPDAPPDIGPMGGLRSMLQRSAATDWNFLVACDMPNLSADLLHLLIESITGATKETDAMVPLTDRANSPQMHPCCAAYRGRCRSIVDAAIADRHYGLVRFLKRFTVETIRLDGERAKWVENWNHPSDIRSLGE